MLYFLVSGTLRIEKEVKIECENFWPVGDREWEKSEVH
jgi:hypothetical protein